MKSLTEFINEALVNEARKMTWPDSVLIGNIEVDPKASENTLKETLKKGLAEALVRYKVLFVDVVAKNLEAANEKMASNKAKYLEKMEVEIREYMKTKPGIMKRSPEKQQKYVEDRLAKLSEEFEKNNSWIIRMADVKLDDTRIQYTYHNDIHSGHTSRVFTKVSDLIEEIADDILQNAEWNEHIKSIMISSNKFGRGYYFGFDVAPVFDDKFEDELDADILKFSEFMTREYNSGRYMGD